MGSLTWLRLVLAYLESWNLNYFTVYSTVYTLHFIAAFLSTKCRHADNVLHMV